MEGADVLAASQAVLRVKRKRGADPAEALVLACKRSRLSSDESSDQPLSPALEVEKTVFKLAATVCSQNEPIQKYIQEALSRDKAAQFLRPSLGSSHRIRKDLRVSKLANQQESRYRLVASHRPDYVGETETLANGGAAEQNGNTDSGEQKEPTQREKESSNATLASPVICGEFQLFDIVQEEPEKALDASAVDASELSCDPDVILCNSVKMIRERLTVSDAPEESQHREKNEDYVYDIYYMEAATRGWIEDILSVKPYNQECELVEAEDGPADDIFEDEDDENEETNWRNEYPDEDEFQDEEEENSDLEEGNGGYDYRSGEGAKGSAWEKYRLEVLKEFDYVDVPEMDSD
ncbi:probable RNA polymerase II nuclear localization protein SLC7A6OS [Ambystoma mexicanum]|uniref:probable RNA polymerase II nuclear localization protein SLC7A6OS n=1 Tax=Ambystoma mexicanum TaxID=8296 RepID=UPI0037E7B7E3